jgi:hypothetical protein
MIKNFLFAATFVQIIIASAFAQTTFNTLKTGHTVSFSVPDYMSRTTGINDASFLQFKSIPKDVYTFMIEDSKEELSIAEMKFTSVMDFYEFFIKDFLISEKKRKVNTPVSFTKDDVNYVQTELTYYDKDSKFDIYYNITIAETVGYFYQILSYTSEENSINVKADLTALGSSLKEIDCP